MRKLYFLAILLALWAEPAAALEDQLDIAQVKNDLPVSEVCDPLQRAFWAFPEYLTYDPDKDRSAYTDNGPNKHNGDNLDLMHTPLTRPEWGGGPYVLPLTWVAFQRADPKKFQEMLDGGDVYGVSYAAYAQTLNMYGLIAVIASPPPVYKLVPKTKMSKLKMSEIYMTPGTSLTDTVDALHASDIVLYGARAYPLVRQPGRVEAYEIDVGPENLPYDQQKFTSRLVCTIISKSTLEARKKERDDSSDGKSQ